MKALHFKHEDTRRFLVLALIVAVGTALAGLHSAFLATLACVFLSMLVVVSLQLHLFRETRAAHIEQLQDIQGLLYLHTRLPLTAPLPPLTGWSATPQLAGYLYARLRHHPPCRVVELGSGASTLVMAYALEQAGHDGTLVSVDHEATFGAQTLHELARHGLAHRACVCTAPLVPVSVQGQTWQWYDLREVPLPEQIDVLVVDGPPARRSPSPGIQHFPCCSTASAPTQWSSWTMRPARTNKPSCNAGSAKRPTFSLNTCPAAKALRYCDASRRGPK